MTSSLGQRLLPYLVCVLLALGTFRGLLVVHEPHFAELVGVVQGVLDGRPNSMAFQSRLLGPSMVWAISQAGISMNAALRVFHAAGLAVLAVLLFRSFRRCTRTTQTALAGVVVALFGVLSLQFRWYHVWDLLDLVLLSLFCDAVLRGAGLGIITTLFGIALLNRESAVYIALYPLLDGLARAFGRGETDSRSGAAIRLVAGGAMLGAAFVYTPLVRKALFRGLPAGLSEPHAVMLGNEFHLPSNLHQFFVGNLRSADLFVTATVLGLLVRYGLQWRRLDHREAILFLIALQVLASTMVFGIVIETRNFLSLLPFLLFLGVSRELRPRGNGG